FLHVVGRATFRAGAPLSAYFAAAGEHRPPILLADGVLPFTRTPLPDGPLIARTYGWIVPVEPGSIHDWELPTLGARIDRAQSQLEERSDIYSVSAPTDTLDAIRATSRVAGERLLILGGDAAVLLLGFAVLASTRMRRDQRAVRTRLTWFGARRSQMLLVAATEVAGITIVASVVGWIVGAGAGTLLAHHLGSPGGLVVEHSIFTVRAFGVAVALAAVTGLVMLAAVRTESIAFGGLRVNVADVAALGALGAVLLALARGKADTNALAASNGTGVFVLLLPGLVLFVLAVAAARLLSPLLRLLELVGRHGTPALRLALLSLARSPGRVLLSVVFFVLSIGVALFAISYRATLERGETEQAKYAVPAPYVLQEDLQKLVTVQQAAPQLAHATPVLRDMGFITVNRGIDFTILALPARSLARIDGWRGDFSSQTPAHLGTLLAPPVTPALRGVDLPSAATHVTLPLTIKGDRVGVGADVLDRRGDFTLLSFGELGRGTHAPTVALPPAARGGRIVALRLTFPQTASFVAGHRESGTTLTVNDTSVGTLTVDRRFAGWIGTNGVHVHGTTLRYDVNRAADSIVRPREPLEDAPVPVVVSPAIAKAAGASGLVPLHVEDITVEGRIVGVARYFPSVSGDLVVADLPTWLAAANTAAPGTATASELWVDSSTPPHVPSLTVTSQRATAAASRADPLARGSLTLLAAAAAVALALAIVGVLMSVVGDRHDESGELFDMSAQGATPADLRRHLVLRALSVAAVGIAGGLAAGAIVSALVVSIVTVTAGAGTPLPPLQLVFDWPLVAVALAVVAAGSTVAALAGARSAR
ncbi:MAG TPA: FtsX-like permease family protein, partial [Gaiellaceae bacterium]|nr:FtsX-like permease family protein [Gaiellaceae bacterium]